MRSVQAKTKPPARRPAPAHASDRSDRSDRGLHAPEVEAAETAQLSSFYHAGPAVPLGGEVGTTGGGDEKQAHMTGLSRIRPAIAVAVDQRGDRSDIKQQWTIAARICNFGPIQARAAIQIFKIWWNSITDHHIGQICCSIIGRGNGVG